MFLGGGIPFGFQDKEVVLGESNASGTKPASYEAEWADKDRGYLPSWMVMHSRLFVWLSSPCLSLATAWKTLFTISHFRSV